jgi:tetraacyldisaccharide 4'-kinase
VLVMDDGLQNPGIGNRHGALIIDGAAGFGNGRLFPAGPLREAAAAAAARCEIAVLIGEDARGALDRLPAALPVLRARLVPVGAESVAGRRVVAFAGIGRPEKFFASLRAAGAEVVGQVGFADHHRYGAGELRRLCARADRAGAVLATTEKDAVRLPAALRARVAVLGVALAWERPHAVELWLNPP